MSGAETRNAGAPAARPVRFASAKRFNAEEQHAGVGRAPKTPTAEAAETPSASRGEEQGTSESESALGDMANELGAFSQIHGQNPPAVNTTPNRLTQPQYREPGRDFGKQTRSGKSRRPGPFPRSEQVWSLRKSLHWKEGEGEK